MGVGLGSIQAVPSPPTVLGPFDPPADTQITQPTTLSVHGVSAPSGVTKVQFWANNMLCYYYLGTATAPSSAGTYSVPFNPGAIPEKSVTLSALVDNQDGNQLSFSSGPYTLGDETQLTVQATASASSGTAPLTVSFSATAQGGKPPYFFSWRLILKARMSPREHPPNIPTRSPGTTPGGWWSRTAGTGRLRPTAK